MALSTRTLLFFVLAFSLALCFLPAVKSLVFGLDFGSRWVKMSVIRGNTFEIILDAQTKRKFMNGLAFHDDERFFAAEAEKVLPRSPQHAYLYTSQLLGKFYNSSIVQELTPHLLYADDLVPGERGTVAVRFNENTTFAVEDLAGMIFNFARETAEHYVHTPVADVVITVPPHWTAEERAAVIEAAELGGFHVMSLINDGTAIALHYAFGKKFEEPKTVVFFDMGHSNTRATLVEYHSVRVKKGGKNMTQPTMKVKAVAYDTRLGGRDFDYRLAEYLAGVAVKQMEAKGIKSSVEEIKANKRAWARLLTTATQAKTVLSANMETYAAVEGLVGEYDLKTTVSRAQFEELCADLFARVAKPIQDVLAEANVTLEEVSSVEVVGGSVRIPKVQAVLKETLGLAELSKTLNGDEAAVLGAVFMAAHMSTSVKVPEHKIKDITPYGIAATLQFTRPADEIDAGETEKEDDDDEDSASEKKDDDDEFDDDYDDDDEGENKDGTVTKVLSLFKPFGRVGAKKTISFRRKKVSNFTVELSYDEAAKLPEDTPRKLALYKVEDLDKLKKYNYSGTPKIILSFRLTTSGLVELETAEAEVVVIKYPAPEPSVTATPTPAAENDTVNEEDAAEEGTAADEKEDEDKDEKEEGAEEETPEEPEEEPKKKTKKDKKKQKKQEKKEKKEKKPKKTVHKVLFTPVVQKLGIPERSFVEKSRARSLLRQWEAKAVSKREKADAKNDLETYIYDVKEKLWDEELEKVSTEEQRDEARDALAAAADWLEGDGIDVSTKEYRDKKAELIKLANPIFERKEELTKRPVQVAMLSYMLNHSKSSLVDITERLKVEDEERDDLLDLIEETADWLSSRVKEQEQKLPHEEPAFKSDQVQAKSTAIEKMLRKLLKRKPRPTPTPETSEVEEVAAETQEEAATTEEELKEDVVPPKEDLAGEDIL